MLKKDLLEKIKNAKEDEDINSLLSGTDIEESFKASGLTLDAFKGKLKEKDFKAFLESENDKYFNKALGTWKENNLEKELEPFITERYPDLVKKDSPEFKLMEEIKKREDLEAKLARKDLLAEAIKYANEKGIKIKSIDRYLEEDLDSTKAALDDLAEDWSKGLETIATEKMKQSSYVPGGSNPDGSKISIGQSIAAQNNSKSSAPSDPWASK